MADLRLDVAPNIGRLDPGEWGRLARDAGLYQSHPWLSWAETSCGAEACYVVARDRAGVLVGAMPAYLLSGADTSWNGWYDPLTVLAGDAAETDGRRSAWFPLLLLGSVSGYHSDLLVDPALSVTERRAVVGELLTTCRSLAQERGARAGALMYGAARTAADLGPRVAGGGLGVAGGGVVVAGGGLGVAGGGVVGPLPTSANTRIGATWPDLDAFVRSFPSRRRYNIQRELDLFAASGHRIVETRLADCLDVVGPLLGNVHRKHGAADTDLETTAYLRSQAAHLNPVSTVFLELSGEEPVGFSLCYQWGADLHVRVVGFDYARSARFAYFALAYYRPLELAIRRRLAGVQLGPGTYRAKVGRGAALEPTWSWVWPPDADQAAWFAGVARPGEDAREAARWLPGEAWPVGA